MSSFLFEPTSLHEIGPHWRDEFYSNYHPASRADDFESRFPYLKKLIAKHIPRDKNTRVLDLGCGSGTLLLALHRMGYKNTAGVDVSASQAELAQHRSIGRIAHSDNLSFLRACGTEHFEVVVTFDVIEHLTREELFALGKEILRVLLPDGVWIIHAPNASGIFGNRVRYADVTHEQAFTPESVRQWGDKLGFSSVQCYEDKPVLHGLKSLLRRILWELLRSMAALCVIAESGPQEELVLSQNLLAVLVK